MRHERFEHGHYFPFESLDEVQRRTAPADLTALSNLALPDELIQLMSGAESTYAGKSTVKFIDDVALCCQVVQLRDFQFPGMDCKIAVDYYSKGPPVMGGQVIGMGNRDVHFQVGAAGSAPVELLCFNIDMDALHKVFEADAAVFGTLTDALGLCDTAPSQLLVALLSRTASFKVFKEMFLGTNYQERQGGAAPTFHKAYEIWMAGSDDDESEGSFDY